MFVSEFLNALIAHVQRVKNVFWLEGFFIGLTLGAVAAGIDGDKFNPAAWACVLIVCLPAILVSWAFGTFGARIPEIAGLLISLADLREATDLAGGCCRRFSTVRAINGGLSGDAGMAFERLTNNLDFLQRLARGIPTLNWVSSKRRVRKIEQTVSQNFPALPLEIALGEGTQTDSQDRTTITAKEILRLVEVDVDIVRSATPWGYSLFSCWSAKSSGGFHLKHLAI